MCELNASTPPDYEEMNVSTSVLEYAEKQGITLTQLLAMVEASARVSHSRGNRRYHNWLFLVENNLVKGMSPLHMVESFATINHPPTPGPGEFLVYEDCEDCDGKGCDNCDGMGEVAMIRRTPKERNGVRYER